jgi:radical SAM protein with 4Fe4S-binding SPASM domain
VQISQAITQMLKARDELGIKVSFGTSTPFCLDKRLLTEHLAFTCGVGTWFTSIDPMGEFRICNQSTKSYGNILRSPLHEIWHSKSINSEYRALDWLPAPCNSCVLKQECLGGCRIGDTGVPRIDPIVAREPEQLLNQRELEALKQSLPWHA